MLIDDELEVKAYYAGHVLGAAMFHVRVGGQSVVYTVRSACTRIHITAGRATTT